MHIGFGKKAKEVFAVADIGSGSVSVAIMEREAGGTFAIVASVREMLPFEERSEAATIAALGTAFDAACAKVLAKYPLKTPCASAYAIIRAPWTNSVTVSHYERFEADTLITDATIGMIAQQSLSETAEIAKENLLEASVIRVELNGYPTGEPSGKRAHELLVASLLSDCTPLIKSMAIETMRKYFFVEPKLRSGTRALLYTLREGSTPGDYVIVDMASEGTNLTVIRNGVTVEHALESLGTRGILKQVSDSGVLEETLSTIRMLSRDECTTASCEAMSANLANAESVLVKTFGEAFNALTARERLPNTLILRTHVDLGDWLSKFFARIDFTQFTLTTQPFEVHCMTQRDIIGLLNPAEGVALSTGIAIAAALVNIEERA